MIKIDLIRLDKNKCSYLYSYVDICLRYKVYILQRNDKLTIWLSGYATK